MNYPYIIKDEKKHLHAYHSFKNFNYLH